MDSRLTPELSNVCSIFAQKAAVTSRSRFFYLTGLKRKTWIQVRIRSEVVSSRCNLSYLNVVATVKCLSRCIENSQLTCNFEQICVDITRDVDSGLKGVGVCRSSDKNFITAESMLDGQ